MLKTRTKLGVGFVLGLCVLAGLISSAEAVIKIETAAVQNGVAFIKGNGAVLGAQITWEGGAVTKANTNNGGFSFFGVLPADCRGELSDTGAIVQVDVLGCTPVSAGAPAPVEVTGQTTLFADGDDGDIQAGVPFPTPRFADQLNGTVTDNLRGLIWLKNANCSTISPAVWATALSNANSLANGQCGLTDTSVAGDWRLPNIKELLSLIDFGQLNPALPSGHPFSGVQSAFYWSSTTRADSPAGSPGGACFVSLDGGDAGGNFKFSTLLVWLVRGGAE